MVVSQCWGTRAPCQITDKNSSLESFKAYTKSGGGRAGRGLTSKGKLLGRALGLNAYAHAVCIVWHWCAPAITAYGSSIK